jgi:hypothetical protein
MSWAAMQLVLADGDRTIERPFCAAAIDPAPSSLPDPGRV